MVRHSIPAIYVEASEYELPELQGHLAAKAIEDGANLQIWIPSDNYTFYGMRTVDKRHDVSAIQLYLDLSAIHGGGAHSGAEAFVKPKVRPAGLTAEPVDGYWKNAANSKTLVGLQRFLLRSGSGIAHGSGLIMTERVARPSYFRRMFGSVHCSWRVLRSPNSTKPTLISSFRLFARRDCIGRADFSGNKFFNL